jgi:maltose-binding protein MalE
MAESLKIPPDWRPRTEEWFAVENVLGTYVNAALSGQATPREAIEAAAKEIEQVMKEAGYY